MKITLHSKTVRTDETNREIVDGVSVELPDGAIVTGVTYVFPFATVQFYIPETPDTETRRLP